MKNNETGEFELVLGNRHLLSGFFVVALLFGVAFAMGYIVGRNSAPTGKPAETAAANPTPRDTRPQAASPPDAPPSTAAAQEPASRDETPTPDKPADAPAQPTTQPARDGPAAAPPPAPAPAAPPEPVPGTYWQVIAVPQAQAEIVAKALKDKGFLTSLGQGPNNLVRVLVGPYPDTQSLGEAKSKLEHEGFHPILKH